MQDSSQESLEVPGKTRSARTSPVPSVTEPVRRSPSPHEHATRSTATDQLPIELQLKVRTQRCRLGNAQGILDSLKDDSERFSKEELDDAKAQIDEAIKVSNKEHAHFEVVWPTSQANHPYFTDDCHYQMQQIGTVAKKIIAKRSVELPGQTIAQPGKVTYTKSKLLDIELPRFTGNYTEWPSFLELFNSVVCGKLELEQVEKFYYLKGFFFFFFF
ncbi:uncharacterized protein LOC117610931 [Osmia lignaria lignaria]|uniref:uncharacterized protein LOC117610931 n=1 Tax=Osmia lignaria lignaria TaxID=1437193 RepID=UPI00402BE4C3